MKSNKEIIEKVMKDNSKGLKRLAEEKPAEERRSTWKRLKKKVVTIFENEEKVGYISA